MDIFPILHILLPVSVAAFVALKKDGYSNSDGFRCQKWRFKDVLIILTGLACAQLICLFAFKKNSISAHELGVYGTVIFSFTVGIIAYISVIRKYGRDSLASFFPPGRINIKILLPVIFFLAYLTIVFGYAHFTNNDQIILDRTEKFHSLQIFRGSTLESITYVVGLVLIAPVLEEILYRGIFFPPFERKLGSGGAICLISFLWALTHLNIDAIASIFIMGLVLGYLYKQTKSLLSGIIFHSLINVFAILTYIFQCF